jgi:hypothetical protein
MLRRTHILRAQGAGRPQSVRATIFGGKEPICDPCESRPTRSDHAAAAIAASKAELIDQLVEIQNAHATVRRVWLELHGIVVLSGPKPQP